MRSRFWGWLAAGTPTAPDVSARIEANCVLPSGEHIARPFRLMPWQKDWINELYVCDAKGNLLHRCSLLGIPKKKGKSTMIAALAHPMADRWVGGLLQPWPRWTPSPVRLQACLAGRCDRTQDGAAPR